MKKSELEKMTTEMKSFVSEVVRKVPESQGEELAYLMTMATMFHEIAEHQSKMKLKQLGISVPDSVFRLPNTTQKGGGGNVKSRSELDNVVLEVVNLLSEKDITICESSYVLEQCNTVIANSTKIQRIKDQISLYHVEYLIWLLTLFQYHLRMDERQETDYQHHHLQRNAHYISLLPNDIEYQK